MISPLSDGIKLVGCSSALSKSGLYDLDYALNPYRGCAHGCLYCYAPDVIKAGGDWGGWVEARTNIPRLLRKEIASIGRSKIGLATVTDPYQPAEERLGLTRACLEVIAQSDAALMLMTKSPLAKRDFDLLNKVKRLEFCVTITTLDETIAKVMEPGAPSPGDRFALLKDASNQGFKTCAMISPWLVSTEEPEAELSRMVETLVESGCSNITVDRLRLRPVGTKRIENAVSAGGSSGAQIGSALVRSSKISIEDTLKAISARERFPRIVFEIPPID